MMTASGSPARGARYEGFRYDESEGTECGQSPGRRAEAAGAVNGPSTLTQRHGDRCGDLGDQCFAFRAGQLHTGPEEQPIRE